MSKSRLESSEVMTTTPNKNCVMAIDPGKKKCGVAVVSPAGGILHREVIPREQFGETVQVIYRQHNPSPVLLGSSTGSKEIAELLEESMQVKAQLVDERHTTELARVRYFKEFPPKGLWKLIPLGLQTPPTCYDDFAAVVMAERYLEEQAYDR